MAETTISDESMDISKLKVPDLKRELKSRGLSTSGNKNDLMERLQTSLRSKLDDTGSAESVEVDDLDDDLLNDDDLDHDEPIDASESVLTELDEQLDVSPTSKAPKRKISETKTSSDSESKPAKKVVLNREPSIPNDSAQKKENGDNKSTIDIDKANEDASDKKVVKLSELSVKERLEMRAKKFGEAASVDAKKVARAQRFGTEGSNSSASSITSSNDPASLEALKKRAERFGGSVSKVMSNMEQQERMERRKQRFGVVAASNGSASQNEKAQQRLERFKTPIK